MNIYIDESGSINNKINTDFIIALVIPIDHKSLERSYKRFVSSNQEILKQVDRENKMFLNGKFRELKGSQFNRSLKKKFVDFFSRKNNFEVYYIRIRNNCLTNDYCRNTARAFNYALKLALQYFISNGYIPREDHLIQLDERNEKTETRHFLENYLNTELVLSGVTSGNFRVCYFESSNNKFIQIADVFSNLLYSHTMNGQYDEEFAKLQKLGIVKFTFDFPLTFR